MELFATRDTVGFSDFDKTGPLKMGYGKAATYGAQNSLVDPQMSHFLEK